jgi:hypothetical protein
MSATIWKTTGCRKRSEGDFSRKAEIISLCGKTMRDFLYGKPYLTHRFFFFQSGKVSEIRKDLLGHPDSEEREYLLSQLRELRERDEISVG